METDKNGGRNYLQAWREFHRLTREELAEKVGTTGAVIWHLEEGQRGLSAKWLRRLAPALKTTPGFLLDYDPHDLPTEMLERWVLIPDDDKPKALAVLEAFARTGTDG